jgi:hypothetical protein
VRRDAGIRPPIAPAVSSHMQRQRSAATDQPAAGIVGAAVDKSMKAKG